jgi:branched-chain amino acid transport system substrate-binding protein
MGTPVIRKLLFTFCTLALTLTAGAYAAEPIKIGTTQSLTGHYKDFGTEQLRGLQMWVADINARGALLGRPVELVHYDDGSRKVRSVEGYTRLIEQDKVDLLVGPYSSALTLKASAATEKYNIPMVASAASADEIWSRGLKNIFGIDTPSSRYLDLDTNVMALLDAKTMAVVYAQTPFAEDVIAGMRTNAAEDGVRIVLEESYPPEQLEFSDLATRLAQVDADVILGISYLNDSVALVRALKQANVKPKLLAFTVGPALKEFGDALGEDAEGVAGIVQWLRSIPLPGALEFAYRYRKLYG